jgi:hypothetical protein
MDCAPIDEGLGLDNFFIIDHSLRQAGGHHFDYVKCVAEASCELGYRTIIGANQKFRRSRAARRHQLASHIESSARQTSHFDTFPQLSDFAEVRCLFRDTTYQKDSYLAGLQHLKRSKFDQFAATAPNRNLLKKASDNIRCRLSRRARRKFICRFAMDCDRFFANTTFTPNDHVFFTTVSELELMGLAIYLSNNLKTEMANWHLQFHYNLFDGRTPEYDAQSFREKLVTGCVRTSLSRLSGHQINLYTTSEALADQFNRLKEANFEKLPYPINPKFAPQKNLRRQFAISVPYENAVVNEAAAKDSTTDLQSTRDPGSGFGLRSSESDLEFPQSFDNQNFDRALRLVCPGEFRREKGCANYLQNLVDRLWPDYLATGKVQVVVQRPKRNWPRKEKIELTIPNQQSSDTFHSTPPIEYLQHPLSEEDYEQLIDSTDCGLLFYDSRAYFSRRAGVLGELLASGKPVIVSAGSWLAQQIQQQYFSHVDKLSRDYPIARSLELNSLDWNSDNVPMAGGLVSFDRANHPFEFSVDREFEEGIAIIRFGWQWPKCMGVDCQINVQQFDQHNQIVHEGLQVVGQLPDSPEALAAFRIHSQTASMKFTLRNAFHDSTASIKQLQLEFLNVSQPWDVPLGAVGVIAAGRDDLFNAVEEITRHLGHYQATANAFSKPWYNAHSATRTVSRLVANQTYGLRAA